MAGHSAWKNMKHRKAAVDKKRGKMWSKASRAIIVAARLGGGDVRFNSSLRMAIDEAKSVNMPRETIEKAVKKGSGEIDGENFQAIRYEGYGAGGVAIIAECLTSNVNRTAPDIRMIFDKNGGNLGVLGSVSYNLHHAGVLVIERTRIEEDRLMEIVLEAGADDVSAEEEMWQITCAPAALAAIRDALEAAEMPAAEAQIMWIPSTTVEVEGEHSAQIVRLIDALEEHDDVQKVFSNAIFID